MNDWSRILLHRAARGVTSRGAVLAPSPGTAGSIPGIAIAVNSVNHGTNLTGELK